jgi:hypothetical protein
MTLAATQSRPRVSAQGIDRISKEAELEWAQLRTGLHCGAVESWHVPLHHPTSTPAFHRTGAQSAYMNKETSPKDGSRARRQVPA